MRKVGIVGCSDGIKENYEEVTKALSEALCDIGLSPVFSPFLRAKKGVFSGSDRERAEALMDFYRDSEITEIFDISGGDLANGILPYLDYETIKKENKRFWGYSDLSVILNALYKKTGKEGVLYSIKNIIFDRSGRQLAELSSFLKGEDSSLFKPKIHFIRGERPEGRLVGGNIRCFLKLAGTEYFPETDGKVLALEAYGGNEAKLSTYMSQLLQLGVFDKVKGVIFGTFTEYLKENERENLNALLLSYLPKTLPVGITDEIGHGSLSKALMIGGNFS